MAEKSNKLREDVLYEQQFGNIPNDIEGRLALIMKKRATNKTYRDAVIKEGERLKKCKQHKLEFDMWKVFKPSHRPRANTRGGFIRMYVPGAADNGRWFENFCKENDLPIINTPCILNIIIYEKTPSSFSMSQKVLAELGILKPWRRTGDFDNYAKSVADAIQHGMLEDDSLVYESTIKRRYSIKPHVHLEIIYYDKFPSVKI